MAELQIDWTQCSIVESVLGRLAGLPVLKNTRMPVSAILDNYDDGLEPAEIAEIFEIPITAVNAILEYREKHSSAARHTAAQWTECGQGGG